MLEQSDRSSNCSILKAPAILEFEERSKALGVRTAPLSKGEKRLLH